MASTAPSLRWRVIDIVTAAVLGVACGLIFAVWNQVGNAALEGLKAITPGLDGLATGIWLLGGTLGGYIIRKPGAGALRGAGGRHRLHGTGFAVGG